MCRDTLKAEKNKIINEITLLWGVPTESMYTSWRFFTSYTWQNEGCVRRTWYVHDKQHQRATRVFCVVCVQTILCQYKTTFMVHLASLPRTCPFISAFMFLCSKTSSRSSTHPNWHTVTLHYLILGDKTKARPQSHCELYAASDPPQSLHWERDCNLGVNQSINVCEDIPSYSPQVALIFTTLKQKIAGQKSQKAQQFWNVYVSKQIQRLIFLDFPSCLRSMTLQGYELLLVSWESRYETNPPKKNQLFLMGEYHESIRITPFVGWKCLYGKREFQKQYWLKRGEDQTSGLLCTKKYALVQLVLVKYDRNQSSIYIYIYPYVFQ